MPSSSTTHSLSSICCTVCGLCKNHHNPDITCQLGVTKTKKSHQCLDFYIRIYGNLATSAQYNHDIRVFEEWENKDRHRRRKDYEEFLDELEEHNNNRHDSDDDTKTPPRREHNEKESSQPTKTDPRGKARAIKSSTSEIDQRNWYQVLDVANDATNEEILQAYRTRLSILQPSPSEVLSEQEKKAFEVEEGKIESAKGQLLHRVKRFKNDRWLKEDGRW